MQGYEQYPITHSVATRKSADRHPPVRHKALVRPLVLVERHPLDEAHVERPVLGEAREVGQLALVGVVAAHDHTVDLDGLEAGGQRVVDRLQHSRQPLAPRDARELAVVQRVQADVQHFHPRLFQRRDLAAEVDGVRGDADGLDTGDAR
jgi:hypothetical protein